MWYTVFTLNLIVLQSSSLGVQEVSYDMQILANLIEFYWIHSRGIGALENSLWGYDGHNVCVWLDALTIDGNADDDTPKEKSEVVHESVTFSLDFYPLCEEDLPWVNLY